MSKKSERKKIRILESQTEAVKDFQKVVKKVQKKGLEAVDKIFDCHPEIHEIDVNSWNPMAYINEYNVLTGEGKTGGVLLSVEEKLPFEKSGTIMAMEADETYNKYKILNDCFFMPGECWIPKFALSGKEDIIKGLLMYLERNTKWLSLYTIKDPETSKRITLLTYYKKYCLGKKDIPQEFFMQILFAITSVIYEIQDNRLKGGNSKLFKDFKFDLKWLKFIKNRWSSITSKYRGYPERYSDSHKAIVEHLQTLKLTGGKKSHLGREKARVFYRIIDNFNDFHERYPSLSEDECLACMVVGNYYELKPKEILGKEEDLRRLVQCYLFPSHEK